MSSYKKPDGKGPAKDIAPPPAPAEVRFLITVEEFRPLGMMNCTITMTELTPELKPIAELNGSYMIRVKKTPTGHAQDRAQAIKLTFVMATADYRLVGIAFTKRNIILKDDPNQHGQVDFPSVAVTITNGISEMTISNIRTKGPPDLGTSFDYAIYLQEVATGQIGIIDPEIINEN